MSLEARLTALADDAFPPTPDLAARWAGSGAPQAPKTAHGWRRWGVAAVIAAVLVPAGTVAAVEVWGPESVQLRSVDRLPADVPPAQRRGEDVASLAEAAARAGFVPRQPPLPGDIRAITVDGRTVRFQAGAATVTELPGDLVVEKTLGSATKVQRLRYDGAPEVPATTLSSTDALIAPASAAAVPVTTNSANGVRRTSMPDR